MYALTTCDTYRHLAARKHAATLDEYRFVARLAACASCANTAWDSALATLQAATANPSTAAALASFRESRRSTHNGAVEEASSRVRVSYIRHTKGGGKTSRTDRVFANLTYDHFLKPKAPVASSDYDALHRAFIDKDARGLSHGDRQSRSQSSVRQGHARQARP
eukprot:jgi/Tetstr1/423005/TSEL_013781.t1